MKKISNKSIKTTLLGLSAICILSNSSAQTQENSAKPASTVAPAAIATSNAKPMSDAERQAQADKMKADREFNMKMGQLNKEIQEAEKAGKADAPETVAKKAELKKMQEERNIKMKAEREKMMKERAANPRPGEQEQIKIAQLTKEIQDAEKAGKGNTPEVATKKAEVKKLQDERNAKMQAERAKMMEGRPMPTPEEIEANKKMGQLNKEIRDAEKEGKGDTPEVAAKKAELKKLQDERVAKMKAEREKKIKEQSSAPKNTEIKAVPAEEQKK
jgi:hypothetical protein